MRSARSNQFFFQGMGLLRGSRQLLNPRVGVCKKKYLVLLHMGRSPVREVPLNHIQITSRTSTPLISKALLRSSSIAIATSTPLAGFMIFGSSYQRVTYVMS